jgi:hypothetical protein
MPRIRTIKPEFFSHELLASKSAHARLLAIGLLTLADCEGRLRWVPMQVHAQVFPWEAEVKIEVLLGELVDCGYALHYEADGKRFVQIVNFAKHQRLSGKEAQFKSRLPEPPKTPEKHVVSGEAVVKHPSASQGSGENPLGTGEQGNKRNRDKQPKVSVEKPSEVSQQAWDDWQAARKKKNAGPITASVMQILGREASLAGMSIDSAVLLCAGRGWINLDHTWVNGGKPLQASKKITPMGYGPRTDIPRPKLP